MPKRPPQRLVGCRLCTWHAPLPDPKHRRRQSGYLALLAHFARAHTKEWRSVKRWLREWDEAHGHWLKGQGWKGGG